MIEANKQALADEIFEKLSYQTLPFRIFDRK